MAILNANTFSDYRQIFIFGKEAQQLLVEQQVRLLEEAQPGLEERDIKVIVVEQESILYHQYKVKPGKFTLLLLGKDNTEKLRAHQLLLPTRLFALIDAMPMRKQEMRNRKSTQ